MKSTTKKDILSLLNDNLSEIKEQFHVRKISLFGSVLSDELTFDSDIDLFIEFEIPIGTKFIHLLDYLENLFNRKVDVITKAGLDSIRIQEIKQSFQQSLVYV